MARTMKLANKSGRRGTDAFLPEYTIASLHEVAGQCSALMRRRTGAESLCVLVTGGTGTGKTVAVNGLAEQLGLDLYRVDLSAVISEYIGETEKNLSAVFREAEQRGVILFFDEADALAQLCEPLAAVACPAAACRQSRAT